LKSSIFFRILLQDRFQKAPIKITAELSGGTSLPGRGAFYAGEVTTA
jgi:hypothetical protein